ncbi:cell wall-binding repeat-containing protein [Glutamicibacter sp.]|uniref:cell wall-binding repeat-containing protein n=1 Tax=Glutamicibacter sp. TaxID=1931995 RepID=UPI003D6B7101
MADAPEPSSTPSPAAEASGTSTNEVESEAPAPSVSAAIATPAAEEISKALSKGGDLSKKERVQLADKAKAELEVENLDAQLGQGAKRIAETGDATIPTMDELADLAKLSSDDSATSIPFQVGAPASLDELRTWRPPGTLGIDVSRHQGDVSWSTAKANGARFAYIKATQSWPSSLYKDPKFSQNYTNSRNAGLIRGAYHFAMPAHSSGTAQAREFMANGGGWTNDGYTMPPLLDIEWNPYNKTDYPQGKGDMCYGMTPSQLVTWIKDFGNTVKAKTGRLPMIYTAQSWWDECTGDSVAFKSWPLHVSIFPTADVAKNPRELPEGWTTFNVWQYSSNSNMLGSTQNVDANVWNGDLTSLRDFAKNRRSTAYKMTTSYFGNMDVWPTRLGPSRMYGANRYGTPVAISKRTFPSGAKTVVVASGEHFADALSVTSLATRHSAPLLLTKQGYLPSEVGAEIKRLNPSRIIVAGGPTAVSSKTVSQLSRYAPVTREAGSTRYGTSAEVASNWSSSKSVFIASGRAFPDALSMAAVAADRNAPLLLSSKKYVPSVVLKQLKRLNPSTVYIAGGTLAVSSAAEKQIRSAVPNARIARYGGETRYETSAVIAKKFWPGGSQRQFIANGKNFPDGLTGAVAAGYNGAPMLLSKKSCLPKSVGSALTSMEGWTNVLIGGPLVLDSTVAYHDDGKLNTCS